MNNQNKNMDNQNKNMDNQNKNMDNQNDNINYNMDEKMYIKCLIHELKTPINTISIGLHIIEKKYKNNKNLLCIINDLQKTIEYTNNTLTNFCIIKDNSLKLNKFTPFNIKNIIINIKKILQYEIKEKNIQFKLNINPNVYKLLYGDVININHCILNLIKNSIKYSNLYNNNNNKIIINIKRNTSNELLNNILDNDYKNIKRNTSNELLNNILDNDYENIKISIVDNNLSILKHIQEKLFQPFNSTSNSGLGLYICKKIINLHNGIIYYKDLNGGNSFNILLNLKKYKNENKDIIYKNENKDKDIIDEDIIDEDIIDEDIIDELITIEDTLYINDKETIYDINNIKYNIIIVDDSNLNCKMMKKILLLNKNINNIYIALNGLDAINQIYNNPDEIDIILLDNNMPNLNGVQTSKLLRDIKFNKLIFGLTGDNEIDILDFTKNTDYIFTKPFDKKKMDIFFNFLDKHDIIRYSDKKLKLVESKLVWIQE